MNSYSTYNKYMFQLLMRSHIQVTKLVLQIITKINIETNFDSSGQQLELREQDKRLGLRDEQGRALYYGQRYTDDDPVNA